MKVRNWLLKFHGYVGVFVGLLIAIIGLTGSLLVFHEPLEQAFAPANLTIAEQSERLVIDQIAAIAQDAIPEGTLTFVGFPQEKSAPYQLQMELSAGESRTVYINPYTGSVMGIWQRDRTVLQPILALHASLLAGELGEVVVGLCAFLLMGLTITGVMLWPGWRKLSMGYNIRWQAKRRLLFYDLHKVGGMVMGLFLFLVSLTGAIIFLLHYSPQAIAFFLGAQPQAERPAIASGREPLSLSEILAIADTELAESKTTRLSFAGEKYRNVTVSRVFPNDPLAGFGGMSNVKIDAYTGEVLGVNKVNQPNLQSNLANFIIGFHFGTFAGVYSQVLYVLVGITPTALLSTGFILWRQRRWAQSRRTEQRELQQRLILHQQQNEPPRDQHPDEDTITLQSNSELPLKRHPSTPKESSMPTSERPLLDHDELDELVRWLGLTIPPEGTPEKLRDGSFLGS